MLNSSMNIEVYFTIKHTISASLSYIANNFGSLSRDPTILNLTSKELTILLSSQKLNVKNEDEVIEFVGNWLAKNVNNIEELELT